MGLRFLAISNISKVRLEGQAEQNYNKFVNLFNQMGNLSSSSVMLTNIEVMRLKLNGLLESGSVEKNTLEHLQLENICKDAMKIQAKFSKSLNDTAEFFSNYNNFNDIFQRISGDKNV